MYAYNHYILLDTYIHVYVTNLGMSVYKTNLLLLSYFSFTVHIISVARVGLNQTFYSVGESAGVVQICAVVFEPSIDCPIEFDFDVRLETSDGSAGSYRNLHCGV